MTQEDSEHSSDKENEIESSQQQSTNKTPKNKRKAYKLRSPVWQHAVKCKISDKLVIKCNRCDVYFVWHGSSTCMLKHIQEQHSVLLESSDDEDDEGIFII
jgi:hypothetical protein